MPQTSAGRAAAWAAAGLFCLTGLTSCRPAPTAGAAKMSPSRVGDFSLTEQDGRTVRPPPRPGRQGLDRVVHLHPLRRPLPRASPTRWPGCRTGLRRRARRPPVTFTVDPRRRHSASAEKVRRRPFGADPRRWLFLTGPGGRRLPAGERRLQGRGGEEPRRPGAARRGGQSQHAAGGRGPARRRPRLFRRHARPLRRRIRSANFEEDQRAAAREGRDSAARGRRRAVLPAAQRDPQRRGRPAAAGRLRRHPPPPGPAARRLHVVGSGRLGGVPGVVPVLPHRRPPRRADEVRRPSAAMPPPWAALDRITRS